MPPYCNSNQSISSGSTTEQHVFPSKFAARFPFSLSSFLCLYVYRYKKSTENRAIVFLSKRPMLCSWSR